MKPSLRPATEADFALAFEIKKDAMGPHITAKWGWNETYQLSVHEQRWCEKPWFIISLDGAEIGTVSILDEPDAIRFGEFYLTGEYKGRGLGSLILSEFLARCDKTQRRVRLEYLKWNPVGSLYKRHGFKVTAENDIHYFMEREPLRNIFEFESAAPEHAEELVQIRINAMRESLTRIGRFNPERARERFLSGFSPEHTRFISFRGMRVGFVVVKPEEGSLKLDHLYIEPEFQGQGIGASVLQNIFAVADEQNLPITVTALRDSDSNRFYERHGFNYKDESDWDINYVRLPETKIYTDVRPSEKSFP